MLYLYRYTLYARKIKYEKSSVSAEDLHILETDHPKNKSSGDFNYAPNYMPSVSDGRPYIPLKRSRCMSAVHEPSFRLLVRYYIIDNNPDDSIVLKYIISA